MWRTVQTSAAILTALLSNPQYGACLSPARMHMLCRRSLITDAARQLERSKMARFDERSGQVRQEHMDVSAPVRCRSIKDCALSTRVIVWCITAVCDGAGTGGQPLLHPICLHPRLQRAAHQDHGRGAGAHQNPPFLLLTFYCILDLAPAPAAILRPCNCLDEHLLGALAIVISIFDTCCVGSEAGLSTCACSCRSFSTSIPTDMVKQQS